MIDVRVWRLLLIAIGILVLVWLSRVRGPIPSRALTASVVAALPGSCFLIELWFFRGGGEAHSLLTFGPALAWIVIGLIALIKSFNLWPVSEQLGYYQAVRFLNTAAWTVSSFTAWVAMMMI